MVSAQLQQGLFNLIYFTWLHNAQAIAYLAGCILTLYLLYKKPNRRYLVLLIGFLVLSFEFQYNKHIVEPLQEQTLQTVLEQGAQGLRFQKYLDLLLQKLVPLSLYLIGWGSIFVGIIWSGKNTDKPKTG